MPSSPTPTPTPTPTPFGKWDIGGCNCGCNCYPCRIPAQDLSLNFQDSGNGVNITVPLTYGVRPGGGCEWASGCFLWVTGTPDYYQSFGLYCAPGCTYVYVNNYSSAISSLCSGSPSETMLYESVAGCSGLTAGETILLSSYTCSPLNLVYTDGVFKWTVTL